jgi:hypothetical protein
MTMPLTNPRPPPNVIPAQAGIHSNARPGCDKGTTKARIDIELTLGLAWVPAFAGMTQRESHAGVLDFCMHRGGR